ncbi:glycosyl hydrolase [Pochonia chlamydosporia 170]|uniref:Glycosyl hydrolase n=1 Tax=Pochonia chlamydosporia 170 TaxID=1380566 RepID=A0A179F1M8_METCM|nr:glycosyl hydrolase [Pochonia chlamydosporia 170]OAQ59355.1 glycosyl hydrolase [Pochonia chlamydosporia 170]
MLSHTLYTCAVALQLSLALGNPTFSKTDIDILAGQHVIYSYNYTDPKPPQELIDLTRAGLVGGVLLYDIHVNDNTPAAMKQLLDAYASSPARRLLQKITGKKTNFLVMTNQEGGTVFNGVPGHAPKESAKQIGQSSHPSEAGRQAGFGAAQSLKDYNFNVNLAPVLGVYREPGNFLDYGGRSYGNTSDRVIRAAVPFIQAQRSKNILVSIKHFPGLGAAKYEQNTDLAPVTLDVSLQDLKNIDTATFAAAIKSGVDMVMPSWAIYPAVDKVPAGLSEIWMKKWLRGKFGFRGVTITEAMEAGSIVPFGDVKTRAKIAYKAGNDLILASQLNVSEGVEIRQTLAAAIRSREIDLSDFMDSTRRIASLKSRTWN